MMGQTISNVRSALANHFTLRFATTEKRDNLALALTAISNNGRAEVCKILNNSLYYYLSNDDRSAVNAHALKNGFSDGHYTFRAYICFV